MEVVKAKIEDKNHDLNENEYYVKYMDYKKRTIIREEVMEVELEGDDNDKSAFNAKFLSYHQKSGFASDSLVVRFLDLLHFDQFDLIL